MSDRLFQLVHNPARNKDEDTIGYDWIDVLAIEPRHFRASIPGLREHIESVWLCRTESGWVEIRADGVTVVGRFDSGGEYVLAPN